MWRLAGHRKAYRKASSWCHQRVCVHVSARLFHFATGVSAKWLYRSRGDMNFSWGKRTGWTSGGAALLGGEVKSRGQRQNAKEPKRERQIASCCLQDYFGKDWSSSLVNKQRSALTGVIQSVDEEVDGSDFLTAGICRIAGMKHGGGS